jgi:hypothetical protein
VEEALRRLAELERFGPTPHAFTFKACFAAPAADELVIDDEISCSA